MEKINMRIVRRRSFLGWVWHVIVIAFCTALYMAIAAAILFALYIGLMLLSVYTLFVLVHLFGC